MESISITYDSPDLMLLRVDENTVQRIFRELEKDAESLVSR